MSHILLAGRGLAALLLLTLALAACDSNDDDGDRAVRYDVTLTEAGDTLATGRLTFDQAPRQGEDVAGHFTLAAADGGPLDSLLIAEGLLEGSFTRDDTLTVQLTDPQLADAALRLSGLFTVARYEGVWGTVTLDDYTERGAFVAVAAN